MFKIFIVLGALLLAQSLASWRDGFRFLRYFRASLRAPRGDYSPPAAVVIPVKGAEPGLEGNLGAFLTQDYRPYRVVFVVATEKDPAFSAIRDFLAKAPGGPATRLVAAGISDERGEKVHNLLRGVAEAEPNSEVLVFADADARPGRSWLSSLVAPLANPEVTVSTGFRWYLPGESFASQLRAAWDTSIAMLLGDRRDNFAWGGSMALRAADFKRLEIAERHWQHTVSDDYALTRAVRQAGGWIRFEPRALVASREETTFGEFLAWADRQIVITRVYAPRLWLLGLAANSLYSVTVALGLVAAALPSSSLGERVSVAALLAAVILLGIAKAHMRTRVARELFPEESQLLSRLGARYWQLAPVFPWVMFWNFLRAGFVRRIEWRGVLYELKSADEVKVLRRRGD